MGDGESKREDIMGGVDFIYYIAQVEPSKDFEAGPFKLVKRWRQDARSEDVSEERFEFRPDVYAAACRLNRGLGLSENQGNYVMHEINAIERHRAREAREAEERRQREEAEEQRRREREAAIAAGNLDGLSLKDVDQDPNYEWVAHVGGYGGFGAAVQHVIRHKATGSLWACCLSVREDVNWHQVEARQETRTVYVRAGEKSTG